MCMADEKKYAVLDTDFVSKTHTIKNTKEEHLVDRVLEFDGYEFYCHEMMVDELSRHGYRESQEWLSNRIINGTVKLTTDEMILSSIEGFEKENCFDRYLTFLKNSVEIFEVGYFDKNYGTLVDLAEQDDVTKERFLEELKACDERIGISRSLGEKRAYVLIQYLQYLHGAEQVCVFCSDDQNARKGLASVGTGVTCICVLSVFYKMMKIGTAKEEAAEFYTSYMEGCKKVKMTKIGVYEWNGTYRKVKTDMQTVFDNIYANLYRIGRDGNLYINKDLR